MSTNATATVVVEALGLNCPLPLLRMHKQAMELTQDNDNPPTDAIIRVDYTDPGTVMDFEAYSSQSDAKFELYLNQHGETDGEGRQIYHSFLRWKKVQAG